MLAGKKRITTKKEEAGAESFARSGRNSFPTYR